LHRRAAGLGPERDVAVANRDLPVGATVGAHDVSTRRIYRSQLPHGVLENAGTAIGRVVAVGVLRGQFVTDRNVAPRRRTGLDGVVPKGMRAMRVVVTDALRPRAGAGVDVLASYDPSATQASGADTTVLVAESVLVLGTDSRAASGNGRAGAFGVTLLVDPDQARDLADAQANGVMTLALVPPEDARQIAG
jgi:Flp pilus assembly protein CpaB